MLRLGFGLPPGSPSLGELVNQGKNNLNAPWLAMTGFVVLGGAYFVLKHVFYAAGSVGIIVEIVGGTFFLVFLLRKGRL